MRGTIGRTPLHHAAIGMNEAVATFLVEKGCDIDARDVYRNTALHYAVHNDFVARCLSSAGGLDAGDELWIHIMEVRRTSENRCIEVAQLLVGAGAYINAGEMAVPLALGIVQAVVLIKEGGNFSFPSSCSKPAHFKAVKSVRDLVKLLLKGKENSNTCPCTALKHAQATLQATKNEISTRIDKSKAIPLAAEIFQVVVQLLLEAKDDNTCDSNSCLAYRTTARKGNEDIRKLTLALRP